MSRTKRGSKDGGYDYWSRRAGNNGSQGYGPCVKKHTHSLERIEAKEDIKEQVEDSEGKPTRRRKEPSEGEQGLTPALLKKIGKAIELQRWWNHMCGEVDELE